MNATWEEYLEQQRRLEETELRELRDERFAEEIKELQRRQNQQLPVPVGGEI